jgi:hypothetical protein
MDGEGVGAVGSSLRVATGGAMMVIEAIKGPGGWRAGDWLENRASSDVTS